MTVEISLSSLVYHNREWFVFQDILPLLPKEIAESTIQRARESPKYTYRFGIGKDWVDRGRKKTLISRHFIDKADSECNLIFSGILIDAERLEEIIRENFTKELTVKVEQFTLTEKALVENSFEWHFDPTAKSSPIKRTKVDLQKGDVPEANNEKVRSEVGHIKEESEGKEEATPIEAKNSSAGSPEFDLPSLRSSHKRRRSPLLVSGANSADMSVAECVVVRPRKKAREANVVADLEANSKISKSTEDSTKEENTNSPKETFSNNTENETSIRTSPLKKGTADSSAEKGLLLDKHANDEDKKRPKNSNDITSKNGIDINGVGDGMDGDLGDNPDGDHDKMEDDLPDTDGDSDKCDDPDNDEDWIPENDEIYSEDEDDAEDENGSVSQNIGSLSPNNKDVPLHGNNEGQSKNDNSGSAQSNSGNVCANNASHNGGSEDENGALKKQDSIDGPSETGKNDSIKHEDNEGETSQDDSTFNLQNCDVSLLDQLPLKDSSLLENSSTFMHDIQLKQKQLCSETDDYDSANCLSVDINNGQDSNSNGSYGGKVENQTCEDISQADDIQASDSNVEADPRESPTSRLCLCPEQEKEKDTENDNSKGAADLLDGLIAAGFVPHVRQLLENINSDKKTKLSQMEQELKGLRTQINQRKKTNQQLQLNIKRKAKELEKLFESLREGKAQCEMLEEKYKSLECEKACVDEKLKKCIEVLNSVD